MDVLPIDQTVAPWTNETPRSLRSSQLIDDEQAMRADLSHWAPVAFDGNGQASPAEYDQLQFKVRSSVAHPPIRVISSAGIICDLSDFTNLDRNTWQTVAIPLTSLGLDNRASMGRLKLKSTVKDTFTLWITKVRLAKQGTEPSIEPVNDQPRPGSDPDPIASEPPRQPIEQLEQLIAWDTIDFRGRENVHNNTPPREVVLRASGQDSLDDSASFAAALDSISEGGIVDVPAGTYFVSNTISLRRSRQILRGAGSDKTRIVFTQPLAFGIAITGGYPQTPTSVISGLYKNSSLLIGRNDTAQAGEYALLTDGTTGHSQVVHIEGRSGTRDRVRLQLSEPLNSDFSGDAIIQVFDANEYSGIESLSLDVASSNVHIGDMIHLRSAVGSRIDSVASKRARGAHLFTRQTYHCLVSNNSFLDATGHGDGKQGYGVDLANSTTGCLIEANEFAFLRHSIILNSAANGNVIAYNYSHSPRHTNFAEGGPGDISFHHFAYGNLVEGNIVERIHIGDAGAVGSGNMIFQNCVTSGPLTIDNSPGATQFIVDNAIYGSDDSLQNTVMPPVLPEKPTQRPYLQEGVGIFDEDGISVSENAAPLFLRNNWYDSVFWQPAKTISSSFYGSQFNPVISNRISGNWQDDCYIEKAM
ncbi:MAG: hypothetical protein AB8B87_12935 [Granulosicoccus sp.]